MLSFMAMDYFQKSPVLFFPLLSLAIFLTVFLVVTLRVCLTNKERYDALARFPLDEPRPASEEDGEVSHGR